MDIKEIYAGPLAQGLGYGHVSVAFTPGGATWLLSFRVSAEGVVELDWSFRSARANRSQSTHKHKAELPALLEAVSAHWAKVSPTFDFAGVTRNELELSVRSAESAVQARAKDLEEAQARLVKAQAALAAF